MRPLSNDGPSVYSGVIQHAEGGECVVRVDVPVLESPDEVDASFVVVEYVLQVVALVPVVVPDVSTDSRSEPGRER